MKEITLGVMKDNLRRLFLKYLTVDSETQDARRKEFNQAIFMPDDGTFHAGCQVFTNTDLDMVMEKFDKATKHLESDLA